MRAIADALGRLAMFGLTLGLGSILGLVAIPIITGVVGSEAWAVQALVQALATLFGVAVAFGWGTTGPGMIAGASPATRPQLYADSLVTRTYLFLIVAPIMATVMVILQPSQAAFVATASVAYLLPYAGASWYFIGESKPLKLFMLDAAPQMLGTVLGLIVITGTSSLTLMVATQLSFNLAAVVLSAAVILRGQRPAFRFALKTSLNRMADQRHGVITAATGALYVNLPLIAVRLLLPAHLDTYAFADRLFRFSAAAFSPVLQFIQGWIPEGGKKHVRHRIVRASQAAPALGIIGGGILALIGPAAAHVLISGPIGFDLSLSVPIGLCFAAIAVSQVVGLACLVAVGRARELARSTLIGALVGAPTIIIGALFAGVQGVAWAVALSELLVSVYQLLALRAYLKSSPR